MKRILVVDDDRELRSNLTFVLKEAGYDTKEASSAREAVELAIEEDFDVVLLDVVMPKSNKIDSLAELRRVSPRSKIIMITAFATIENAVDAIKRGASDYLSKPFKIDTLLTTIRRVLEEGRFEVRGTSENVDCLLSALSNPIRRKILKLISQRKSARLMELSRELDIEDHTKVIFHLKILKECGIIEQDKDKTYSLSSSGEGTLNCLKLVESHLSKA
ncbi:MAG: response regulator [Nitrospirae bacterium]|nr:response regulator [Nitrospirota bacterium]